MGADLQISRWIDRVRRAGGTKGPAQSPLDDSFYPMLLVDDLSASPYKWLSRDFIVSIPFLVTAAAAQFPTFLLNFNPSPAASYLVWLRKLSLSSGAAAGMAVVAALDPTGLGATTGTNVFSRDTRNLDGVALPNSFLAGVIQAATSSDAAVRAAAEIFARYNAPATPTVEIALDWVLNSGHTWSIQGQTAAGTIGGTLELEVLQRQPSET